MIEAVFFDGDDTLWDFGEVMRTALGETLDHLHRSRPGPDAEHLTVEHMIADRVWVEADPANEGTTLEALRLAAFERSLERIGSRDPKLAETLNRFYLERRFAEVILFDDVLPVLSELSAELRLGLLSNGNGYPESAGLAGVFSVVVFADDHGVRKPDRRLFDLASRQIDLPPDRLLMVGDSLANDVAGAQAAGWSGFWLNRRRSQRPLGAAPDAELHSLRDLPVALEAVDCAARRAGRAGGRTG